MNWNPVADLQAVNLLSELVVLLQSLNDMNYQLVEQYEEALILENALKRENRLKKQQQQAIIHKLVREIPFFDDEYFFTATRLSKQQFDDLLLIVGPSLVKHSIRKSIEPGSRLFLTLRYLATGESYHTLRELYGIGYSTLPKVVNETCQSIHEVLFDKYMPILTKEKLFEVSKGFEGKTRYPNVIGSIDGKTITIRPRSRTAAYYDYKKSISFLLLGICDINYSFIYFNIAGFGYDPDDGTYLRKISLYRDIADGSIELPHPSVVNNTDMEIPYCFLGNTNFPLRPYLMTPYFGKNLPEDETYYNSELLKTTAFIENTFGVLSARWQILLKKLTINPDKVDKLLTACVLLHNFILAYSDHSKYLHEKYVDHYVDGTFIEGEWRKVADNPLKTGSSKQKIDKNTTRFAKKIRDSIKEFLICNR